MPQVWWPKLSTWRQVGGPRDSKIEPETLLKSMLKTCCFRHRILKGLELVLGGFLVSFFDICSLRYVPTSAHRGYACTTTKPQFLLGFKHFEEEAHIVENYPNKQKINEKIKVLWGIDFGGMYDGFRKGFGRPKSMIFTGFGIFFRSKI